MADTDLNNKDYFIDQEGDNFHKRNLIATQNKDYSWPFKVATEWLIPFNKDINLILEIGCGGGHQINRLCNDLSSKGVGIDPSKLAISAAQIKYPANIQFKVGTSEKIRENSEYFDAVLLGDFLYLVDKKNIYHTVAEADRVLKPGGFLLIIDFDSNFKYTCEYKHLPGVTTYKSQTVDIFLASGHYSLVNKLSHSNLGKIFHKDFKERKALYLLYKEPIAYLPID